MIFDQIRSNFTGKKWEHLKSGRKFAFSTIYFSYIKIVKTFLAAENHHIDAFSLNILEQPVKIEKRRPLCRSKSSSC